METVKYIQLAYSVEVVSVFLLLINVLVNVHNALNHLRR